MRAKLDVHPLTPDRWDDLVELFERRGASVPRQCWCMYYRRSGGGSDAHGVAGGPFSRKPAENRRALKALVDGGTVPGLIGYRDGRPVGWISLGPREEYVKLRRSPVMKPVDEKPVWSIVCFFVDAEARGAGVTSALLDAGIAYARSRGATLLEAYPVDGEAPPSWFGRKSTFDRAGFEEVARRKPSRPVVRRPLRRSRPST